MDCAVSNSVTLSNVREDSRNLGYSVAKSVTLLNVSGWPVGSSPAWSRYFFISPHLLSRPVC